MYRPSQDSVADCADESRIVSAGVATNGSSIHQKHGSPGLSIIVAPEVKVPFSLAQVAVFLAVARTGSPTSASLECSISQPAVSKSLSGLEQVSQQCFRLAATFSDPAGGRDATLAQSSVLVLWFTSSEVHNGMCFVGKALCCDTACLPALLLLMHMSMHTSVSLKRQPLCVASAGEPRLCVALYPTVLILN